MEDIHFSCPICTGHLMVDGEAAGRDAACPHCGKTIHIPAPTAEPAPVSAPLQVHHEKVSLEPDPAPAATAAPAPVHSPADAHPEKLSFQKNPVEAWKEHTVDSEEKSLLAHLGFDTEEEDEAESPRATGGQDGASHGSDVNFDQPWHKKKDHWFTENHKRYHYCYYNPHAPVMKTACGAKDVPVSADIAPDDLHKVKKHAFCKKCLQMMGQTAAEVIAST
jgi:hypothetical protein